MTTRITEKGAKRREELLRAMNDEENRERWFRPMDIGARDGSHHSATLASMARAGLVERAKDHAVYCYHGMTHNDRVVTKCCCKGSCRYRLTDAGRAAAPEKRTRRA